MSVFASADEVESVFGDFFERITSDPELRPKFVEAATSFRADHTDPDSAISLDATVDPPIVLRGEAAAGADVEVRMRMSADDGHKFWLGQLNIPMALARRKVAIDGPVQKLLKLLPAMQPAFPMYRAFLEERGLTDKLPD